MKAKQTLIQTAICILLSLPISLLAQEENTVVYQSGKKYIDFNVKSFIKYNARVAKQQGKLLKKLKRKEQHYANKLKRKDSTGFANYCNQRLTYDSISKISINANHLKNLSNKPNSAIDSLKAIQKFVAGKIHLQGGTKNELQGYDSKLANLKGQSNYNSYINDLIGQRTSSLENINDLNNGKIRGFNGVNKNVYYAQQKIKAFKSINDEPNKVEEEALEILQGQEGFEKYLQNGVNSNMPNLAGKSTSDLEKMGYQTKRQMQEQLQKKFGSNLSGLQQNMGKQITEYQDQLKEIKSAANSAKQTKQSVKQLRHIDKPAFRINPMRGLPFSQRIEKQYNWQTTRATIDGKPAMLQLAALAGFKHTQKLIYGIGIATSIGLGQNWNNIKFTFEGIGLRTFAEWKWQYGIGVYTGYERMYKQAAFLNENAIVTTETTRPHNTKSYNESVLIGLAKTYRINDKWNGSLQVLYDVWWKEKGLRSPIQLRIASIKK